MSFVGLSVPVIVFYLMEFIIEIDVYNICLHYKQVDKNETIQDWQISDCLLFWGLQALYMRFHSHLYLIFL